MATLVGHKLQVWFDWLNETSAHGRDQSVARTVYLLQDVLLDLLNQSDFFFKTILSWEAIRIVLAFRIKTFSKFHIYFENWVWLWCVWTSVLDAVLVCVKSDKIIFRFFICVTCSFQPNHNRCGCPWPMLYHGMMSHLFHSNSIWQYHSLFDYLFNLFMILQVLSFYVYAVMMSNDAKNSALPLHRNKWHFKTNKKQLNCNNIIKYY